LAAGRRLPPGQPPADFVGGVLGMIRRERRESPGVAGPSAGLLDEVAALFPRWAGVAGLVLVLGAGGEFLQSRRDGGLGLCLMRAAGAVAVGGDGGVR
jgi:hypothetical protein